MLIIIMKRPISDEDLYEEWINANLVKRQHLINTRQIIKGFICGYSLLKIRKIPKNTQHYIEILGNVSNLFEVFSKWLK